MNNILIIFFVLSVIMNVFLLYSFRKYRNVKWGGSIEVTTKENGKKNFLLEVDGDPQELEHADRVLFKVNATGDNA